MRPLLLVPAILAFALTPLVPLVGADAHGDCDSKGNTSLGVFATSYDQNGDPSSYVDDRNYALGNGLWMYLESNGEYWLQRGGASDTVPDDSEICTDDSDNGPDQLMF